MRIAVTPVFAVALALAGGCAGLVPRSDPSRPTALMEDAGAKMSAIEMRQRVDAMVPPFLAFVEQTADRIRAETSDPEIRRRALRLKIDMVPLIYRAAFQADPLAAALDIWLLSYQMEDCLEAGTGPCNFGPLQPLAREAARRLREAFDQLFQQTSLNREALDRGRELVRETASRHPLEEEGSIRLRHTITEELAEAMDVEGLGAFDVLGDVSITLTNLTNRLNFYIDDVARLGRWHAELLAEDMATWPMVERALTDLDRLTDSANSVATALEPEGLNALVDRPLDLIQAERQVVLAEVDRQRMLTLQYLSEEREATLEFLLESVQAERTATLAQVRQERIETLLEIERLRRALIADGGTEGFRLVDHLIWRLAQLLGGLLLLAAILAGLVLRLRR
jgi:hypothetical protein